MFVTTLIVLGATCVLLGAYTVLSYLCKQRLATVRADVAQEFQRKVKHAEKLDMALARAIADGKRATGDVIDTWQSQRADMLPCSRTGQPWAWDEEDLAKWAKEQAASQTDSIKRRTLVTLAMTTIVLIAIAGGSCALYYSYYASHHQPMSGMSPVPEDFTPVEVEPPSTTATAIPSIGTPSTKPSSSAVPQPQQMPPSSNPQGTK